MAVFQARTHGKYGATTPGGARQELRSHCFSRASASRCQFRPAGEAATQFAFKQDHMPDRLTPRCQRKHAECASYTSAARPVSIEEHARALDWRRGRAATYRSHDQLQPINDDRAAPLARSYPVIASEAEEARGLIDRMKPAGLRPASATVNSIRQKREKINFVKGDGVL